MEIRREEAVHRWLVFGDAHVGPVPALLSALGRTNSETAREWMPLTVARTAFLGDMSAVRKRSPGPRR
jgi:hypothetical protein